MLWAPLFTHVVPIIFQWLCPDWVVLLQISYPLLLQANCFSCARRTTSGGVTSVGLVLWCEGMVYTVYYYWSKVCVNLVIFIKLQYICGTDSWSVIMTILQCWLISPNAHHCPSRSISLSRSPSGPRPATTTNRYNDGPWSLMVVVVPWLSLPSTNQHGFLAEPFPNILDTALCLHDHRGRNHNWRWDVVGRHPGVLPHISPSFIKETFVARLSFFMPSPGCWRVWLLTVSSLVSVLQMKILLLSTEGKLPFFQFTIHHPSVHILRRIL